MAKILNFQRARVHAKERKTPAGEVFPAEPNDPPLSPAAQLRTYLAVQRQMVEAVTRPRTRPVSTDREQKKPFIPEGKVRELQEGGLFVERDLSPFSLSAYVGQEAIKQDLRGRIERIKRDPQLTFPHLLLSGPPEMGKRTLALALAQEVGVTIRSCDPAVLGRTDLAAVLTNLDRGDFFLIEEIESLNKEIFKFLLQAIEDWQLDLIVGKGASRRSITLDLKAFTLIGTTSKPAQVDKRLRRWLVVLNFAPYDVNQLGELILRLAKQESVIILPDAASLLAEYCDGSVGNARVLVKRVRDYSRDLIAVTPEVAREALVSFGYLD